MPSAAAIRVCRIAPWVATITTGPRSAGICAPTNARIRCCASASPSPSGSDVVGRRLVPGCHAVRFRQEHLVGEPIRPPAGVDLAQPRVRHDRQASRRRERDRRLHGSREVTAEECPGSAAPERIGDARRLTPPELAEQRVLRLPLPPPLAIEGRFAVPNHDQLCRHSLQYERSVRLHRGTLFPRGRVRMHRRCAEPRRGQARRDASALLEAAAELSARRARASRTRPSASGGSRRRWSRSCAPRASTA